MIGNAVPVQFAFHLAKKIASDFQILKKAKAGFVSEKPSRHAELVSQR
jgi:hypothetical protein